MHFGCGSGEGGLFGIVAQFFFQIVHVRLFQKFNRFPLQMLAKSVGKRCDNGTAISEESRFDDLIFFGIYGDVNFKAFFFAIAERKSAFIGFDLENSAAVFACAGDVFDFFGNERF